MLIGNGLLAKKFSSYKNDTDIIIFASGVSNSACINKDDYIREEKLLRETIEKYPDKIFIYFSSCDIINSHVNSKPYYLHKSKMEQIIHNELDSYYIFRLPQIIGNNNNNNTLINFFYSSIKEEIPFTLYVGTEKNIIDIEDVYKICSHIIDNRIYKNEIINIVNKNYVQVEELVKIFETFLHKKALYKKELINASCRYDGRISENISQKIKLSFDNNYLKKSLQNNYFDKK